jgi:hypothetical protein
VVVVDVKLKIINHCLVSYLEVNANCGKDTIAALLLLNSLIVDWLTFLLDLPVRVTLWSLNPPEDGSIVKDCP